MNTPETKSLAMHSREPFVSVIIPVYNDPEGLSITLTALAQVDYPHDCWEVLVVDNNSSDNTLEVARLYAATTQSMNVLEEGEIQSSYAARNKGIANAQGDILAFLDAGVLVEVDWLQTAVANFREKRRVYVGCRVLVYAQHDPPNSWELYDQRTGFQTSKYLARDGYAPTICLFVLRSVVDKVGPFEERLISGGDNEFGTRVKQAGLEQFYDAATVVRHPARASMRAVWKKYYRVGKGHWDLRSLFPDRYRPATFRFVLSSFRPLVRIHGLLDEDAGPIQKLQMAFAANLVQLARALGRLVRYFQTQGRRTR